MGNSLLALVFGRDDGEYFRATGASLAWEPASRRRQWFSWSLYAERQGSVTRNTNASLPRLFDTDHTFRENIDADEADQYGSGLVIRPYWGSEVRGWQAGVELALRGEVGDYGFGTASLTLRSVVPLGQKFRMAFEAAGGSAWGNVPVQRLWYLGGSRSLRGYEGSSAVGRDFTRARVELARVFPIASVTVFGDAGWAGAWEDYREEDALYSVGVGGSLLDGLVRMDIARALRAPTGWRLELYVDGII
jgi:outer membrane protein assembly factor BamA